MRLMQRTRPRELNKVQPRVRASPTDAQIQADAYTSTFPASSILKFLIAIFLQSGTTAFDFVRLQQHYKSFFYCIKLLTPGWGVRGVTWVQPLSHGQGTHVFTRCHRAPTQPREMLSLCLCLFNLAAACVGSPPAALTAKSVAEFCWVRSQMTSEVPAATHPPTQGNQWEPETHVVCWHED